MSKTLPKGQIQTRCAICESINHWAQDCPDKGSRDFNTLCCPYQSDYDHPNKLKNLVVESWNAAVLDSGASKTVCGQSWLDCYIESLNESNKSILSYNEASNFYRFGDGKRICSTKSVKLPVVIGQQPVTIESDVVHCDVPLLMSRSSMKRSNMHLNSENDTANTFNQDINLIVTKSGHYAILLTVPRQLLHEFERNGSVNITLSAEHSTSKTAIANKLHRQFDHPPPGKLLRLLNSAGHPWSEDKELKN